MSCSKQYPQYIICTPRQDKIFIHRENIAAFIREYNNEYQHSPRGLGSAQGDASNWRMEKKNSCRHQFVNSD